MKKNESGFSLFELMVVIAIIGILSSIAIPNMISWRQNASIRGSAFNLKSDLELAKMRAIRNGGNVAVLFTSTKCEIFQDTDGDFVRDSGEAIVSSRDFQNLTVTPAFAGSPTSATGFNSRGQIARVAGTSTDKIGTVTIKNAKTTIVISINRIGFISLS